ncbi:MAG: pyruvate formate lyase family protein, partial [Geobacteraceae bacterium]|nr:pyruvate formate lyase family protein [Geobacteraceae bacterium]
MCGRGVVDEVVRFDTRNRKRGEEVPSVPDFTGARAENPIEQQVMGGKKMASKSETLCRKSIDVSNLPGPTPRVEAIKQRFITIIPEICVERAHLITESYRETEDLPIHLRRARAFEKILKGMSVFIQDDE